MADIDNATAGVDNTKPEGAPTEQEKFTFTQEELEKKLQSEADRRVTQAKSKWEKEYQEKVKYERREAERLAKLSEDERQRELDERYKNELSKREKELLVKEMKLAAVDILTEKRLPVKFSDILIGETAEETQEKIKNFETAFRDEVERAVNDRLKSTTSAPSSGTKSSKSFNMNDLIRNQMRR